MINVSLSGRVGKEQVNAGGFLSIAIDQYKKGAEGNRETSWISVYIPDHLREYTNKLEKGNAVDVIGQLDFTEDEYNGEKIVRLTLFASSIKKTFAANGGNCFFIKSARLGKDPVASKNGYMLNLAYDVWSKGESSTRWVTGFTANDAVAKKIDLLNAKKGTGLDVIANSFSATINERGYVNVILNIVDVTYAAFNKKREENSTEVNQGSPENKPEDVQGDNVEEFDIDSLDDMDFF